jgi:glycerophosphoryl diester phosphodiesterase
LHDNDPDVLKEALLALSRCPGEVPAEAMLPFLTTGVPTVRAAAALALARHQPQIAATAVMDLLRRDEEQAARQHDDQLHSGTKHLSPEQIRPIDEAYREQMKLVQALASLPPDDALGLLASHFDRSRLFWVTAVVTGYRSGTGSPRIPHLRYRPLDQPMSRSPIARNGRW